MTIRNSENQVPAVKTKNMFKGSSFARSCVTACPLSVGPELITRMLLVG